jgi:hypothetical protein
LGYANSDIAHPTKEVARLVSAFQPMRWQNRGGRQASLGGGGWPNLGSCRRRGAAGRGQGASWQGDGPDLGQRRGGGSPDGLGRCRVDRWQAGVEVIGAVGMVGEELLSSEKVTAVEPSSEEGHSGLAPARALVADGADDGDGIDGGSLGLDFGSEGALGVVEACSSVA